MVRPLLASKLGSFGSFCRRDLRCSGRRRQSPGETARNKRRGQGRTWAFANNYMECIYIICNMYIYIYTYLYNYEILWTRIYIYIQICTSTYIRIYIYIHTHTHTRTTYMDGCMSKSVQLSQEISSNHPKKTTRRTRSAGGRRWDQVRHLQREQGRWNFPDLSHTSQ